MTSLEQSALSQIVKQILKSDKDNGSFQMIISIIEVKKKYNCPDQPGSMWK